MILDVKGSSNFASILKRSGRRIQQSVKGVKSLSFQTLCKVYYS